jgi:hypothetical protein
MKANRMLLRVGLAMAGAAVVAVASTTLVRAFNPQPDPPGDAYSLIGLVADQTIEVTVSNFDVPGRGIPPGPCDGSLTLYDVNGNVVKTQTFALAAGHSTLMSFTVPPLGDIGGGDDTNLPAVQRTYLRAGVSFRKAGGERVGVSPGPCVSGVNVIGATGATTLLQTPGAAQAALTGNHNETLVIDSDN